MTTRHILLILCLLGLSACSDEREAGDHVWRTQTDTIEKAENVEQLLIETDQKRREMMEQQIQ